MDSITLIILVFGALIIGGTVVFASVVQFAAIKYGNTQDKEAILAEFEQLKTTTAARCDDMLKIYEKVDMDQINKLQASINELSVRIGLRGK